MGHCLISNEDPAAAVREAGDRLGYIHFDDNDGREDLHWGLLQGCLTERQIAETIDALRGINFSGPLCLEFLPTDESEQNLREGVRILRRHLA